MSPLLPFSHVSPPAPFHYFCRSWVKVVLGKYYFPSIKKRVKSTLSRYEYPVLNIRGTMVLLSGVRGYQYPEYEGITIWGTRVLLSGVRGYYYPGYEGITIRGTRVLLSGVRAYYYTGYYYIFVVKEKVGIVRCLYYVFRRYQLFYHAVTNPSLSLLLRRH